MVTVWKSTRNAPVPAGPSSSPAFTQPSAWCGFSSLTDHLLSLPWAKGSLRPPLLPLPNMSTLLIYYGHTGLPVLTMLNLCTDWCYSESSTQTYTHILNSLSQAALRPSVWYFPFILCIGMCSWLSLSHTCHTVSLRYNSIVDRIHSSTPVLCS